MFASTETVPKARYALERCYVVSEVLSVHFIVSRLFVIPLIKNKPKAKHPPWRCLVSASVLSVCLYKYAFISLLLHVRLSANLYLTLNGVLWIFMLATGVITLPFSLTEWVKTQYLYNVTCIKHLLYGPPDPSTSDLLLLPPEVRLHISEEVIPRLRCARGDTRIIVDCEMIDDIHRFDYSPWGFIMEESRRGPGHPPRFCMRTSPRIPVEFLRTSAGSTNFGYRKLCPRLQRRYGRGIHCAVHISITQTLQGLWSCECEVESL